MINFDVEEFRKVIREEFERSNKALEIKEQYEPVLVREDLRKIFQASDSVITKLINIPSFPKFPHIKGHYPRDLVFKWIEDESNQETQRRLGVKKLRAI